MGCGGRKNKRKAPFSRNLVYFIVLIANDDDNFLLWLRVVTPLHNPAQYLSLKNVCIVNIIKYRCNMPILHNYMHGYSKQNTRDKLTGSTWSGGKKCMLQKPLFFFKLFSETIFACKTFPLKSITTREFTKINSQYILFPALFLPFKMHFNEIQ